MTRVKFQRAQQDIDIPAEQYPVPLLWQTRTLAHLCPMRAWLMGIEDGSHKRQLLPRNLSPEARGLETIGQGHHNGTKFIFNIFLVRGRIEMNTTTMPSQNQPRLKADSEM